MKWPMVKLSEVAPAKPLKVVGLDENDQVLQVTLDHIESNSGLLLKKNYLKIVEAGSSTHWFDNRYVLYSKLRPYLNKVLLPDEQGLGTTELVPMLPDPNRLCRKYLAYYLKSQKFVDWVSVQTAGAKMPRVSMKVFWDHEIPLPPLEEQKRIAAILDKADAIRRKRQQAIDLADEFLRSVFLDMFGDPVTNPKGWVVKALGEITTFENGDRSSNYPSGDDIVQSGVLFLSTKNIVSDKLDVTTAQFITEDKFESLSRGKAKKGDLIITLRGTLGSCCIFDCEYERAFINAQMMIVRPHDHVRSVFLHDLLVSRAIKSHFQKLGQGAAVPQLTARQLKELELPIPSMDMQVKYEKVRSKVFYLLERMLNSSSKQLFESISQKAFFGEL